MKYYRAETEKIAASGFGAAFWDRGLQGFLGYSYGQHPFLGQKTGNAILLWNRENNLTRSLLMDAFHRQQHRFAPGTQLNLIANYRELFSQVLDLGFGLNSVELTGDVRTSLHALAEVDALSCFAREGLELKPLSSPEQVEAIVHLKTEYFSQHPEFCWFYNKNTARNDAERMNDLLRAGKTKRKVLYDPSGLVGTFAFDFIPDDYMVGLDFTIHPRFQRKGLGTAAYKLMFEEMAALGVEKYRGSTSNPAVLKMAKRLQREATVYHFRLQEPYFPLSHFSGFLPQIEQ